MKCGKCLSTDNRKIKMAMHKAAVLVFLFTTIAIAAIIKMLADRYAKTGLTCQANGHDGGLPTIKSFDNMQSIPNIIIPVAKMLRPGFINLFINENLRCGNGKIIFQVLL